MPTAFARAASTLQPEPEGSAPLSFARLIQPALDEKCVSCHGTAKPGDLRNGDYQSDPDRFYTSYKNLKPYLSYYSFAYDFGPVARSLSMSHLAVPAPLKCRVQDQELLWRELLSGRDEHRSVASLETTPVIITPSRSDRFAHHLRLPCLVLCWSSACGGQASYFYSTDGAKFTSLGGAFTMKKEWQFFLGYRYGIFNYATQALGGSIIVSSFELTTP